MKMKKYLGSLFLAGAALALTSVVGFTVDASETSTGSVQFGTQGALTLDYVPNFNFGEQEMIMGSHKLLHRFAINEEDILPKVLVSDYRGVGSGWTLYVAQEEKFKEISTEKELEANIVFFGAEALKKDEDNIPSGAVPDDFVCSDNGELGIPIDGSLVQLWRANENEETSEGMGEFKLQFPNSKGEVDAQNGVRLDIYPGVRYKGNYEAELIWTLSPDAPPEP